MKLAISILLFQYCCLLPFNQALATTQSCKALHSLEIARPQIVLVANPSAQLDIQLAKLRTAVASLNIQNMQISAVEVDDTDSAKMADQLDAALPISTVAFVTISGTIARELTKRNLTQPTIFATFADPVEIKIIDQLNDRKKNATGLTLKVASDWKALEALTIAFPNAKRIGLLVDANFFPSNFANMLVARAPAELGVTVEPVIAHGPAGVEAILPHNDFSHLDAWLIPNTSAFVRYEARVLSLLTKYKVPIVTKRQSTLDQGATLAYAVEFENIWTEFADIITKICNGVDARQIPIVRPHKVFLGVSHTNAAKQGIKIDPKIYRLATFTH